MPIAEAKIICPNLVLADGEDLSPFRDVSKRLYAMLRSYSWNGKIERLGLDEVFMDVTDMVSYNVELLNRNALPQSYFCLSRTDPEAGFEYDAMSFAGCVYGEESVQNVENLLYMRLLLGSHLAQYLRLRIEDEGYTTACGIATNKVLAKLVGDKNKPRNQTTLLALGEEDILSFMDSHPLRRVPGIGFRTTSILESFVLKKKPDTNMHSMECSTTVGQVRTHPSISPPILERLLSGPGAEKGLGSKVWSLLHGVDDADVKPARDVPTQISIEDTYKGIQPHEIRRELHAITASLLRRMHIDLLDDTTTTTTSPPPPTSNQHHNHRHPSSKSTPTMTAKKWLAQPKTLRLSTRQYIPLSEHQYHQQNNDPSAWARTSRSCTLPSFALDISLPLEQIATRLVDETLLPLFWKMNPNPPVEPSKPKDAAGGVSGGGGGESEQRNKAWGIGLINVCVTNMVGAGSAGARDIGEMFRGVHRRNDGTGAVVAEAVGMRSHDCDNDGAGDDGLGERRREATTGLEVERSGNGGDDDLEVVRDDGEGEDDGTWDNDTDTSEGDVDRCALCDRFIPRFALSAHERYHSMEDS
ncbi:DNA/RNA polymerase [Parathielavia appendiculata]|uniref:DNA/RNA polymerase n=1 Tax=Parathielavia appendiculata TaxID=2587402 RepID=A0AAN6TXZ2_9PEZI|nr:DNA/RNA polymerase [Parathielavia appendiculata]